MSKIGSKWLFKVPRWHFHPYIIAWKHIKHFWKNRFWAKIAILRIFWKFWWFRKLAEKWPEIIEMVLFGQKHVLWIIKHILHTYHVILWSLTEKKFQVKKIDFLRFCKINGKLEKIEEINFFDLKIFFC